ncbi:hypothetical protein ABJ972_02720 [Mesomycoplasma hyopneumoniae]|uniref:hypothetical protein n=1 Tax=Mesomycoplasma hyopneumoniae TaxID=2099 RepID=UPI0032B01DEB
MKKMLFNLGDLSQLPGIFVPVYQVRNIDIYQSRNPLIISKPIDTTPPIKILTDNIENISMLEKFDKNFTKMQELIEDVDFLKLDETKEMLNLHLNNFASLDEKLIFSKEFYKNLELLKNKEISPEIAISWYQHFGYNPPEALDQLRDRIDPDFTEVNHYQANQKILTPISTRGQEEQTIAKINEQEIIDQLLNNPELRDKFLRLQSESQKSIQSFDNLLDKYQKLYYVNNGLNTTSAVLAGISWALVGTYSVLAAWSFGLTATMAAAAAIQASILTYFVEKSFEAQEEMKKNLEQMHQFKSSSIYEKIVKFQGMSFEEFKNLIKEEIEKDRPTIKDIFKNITISKIKSKLQELVQRLIIKIIAKRLGEWAVKIVNAELGKITLWKLFGPGKLFSGYILLRKLAVTITAKKVVMFATGFLSPIGKLVDILDTLVFTLSFIGNTILIDKIQEID